LGIGYKNPYKYFQIGITDEEKEKIEELISQRNESKKREKLIKKRIFLEKD